MTKGHCLCGAVRFSLEGQIAKTLHCHCESCRRATSSPFTTFIVANRRDVTFAGDQPMIFASSPGVERWFCGTCGSPLAYTTDREPDTIDLYAASLDDQAAIQPQMHVYDAERVGWIKLSDDLPRHPRGSAG